MTIIFLLFANNFSVLLLCKIYDRNSGGFFSEFFISRGTEIPIVLKFRLRVYT